MCGIAGIVDLKDAREIDRAALQRMTDALTHRGPDGEGFFVAPGVGFGHRRLAIIDRDGGEQPFHTQNGDTLSYNGEIYNYQSLNQSLMARGVILKTRSDTETLAEGFSRFGAAYLTQLRGMFAFSYWDARRHQLTLARDRLGEKPLYYSQTPDGFLLFASEAKALIASNLIAPALDPQAVADYFYYGYVPAPKSIYQSIKKLPPAHILTTGRNQDISLTRYWRPQFDGAYDLSFEAATECLREKLNDAVASQLCSDVPLGAFLSGGVDSAGIVAAMRQHRDSVTACTIGFREADFDERKPARAIASQFQLEHHEYVADLDAVALIGDVAKAYDEPFADASALPSYLLCKLARRHVTVALSGDGGDEIFAGYRRYPFFVREEAVRRAAPVFMRRALFGTAGSLYPKLDWAPRMMRLKTTLHALAASSAEAYAAAVAINLPSRAAALLHGDVKATLGAYHPDSVIREAMEEAQCAHPLSAAQYTDLLTWLPGRMLTKIDRASMAHSLEVRPPMLDYQLLEWAGGLPPDYKYAHGEGKRVLKAALAPQLGYSYLQRPKKGFAPPLDLWMRREKNNPLDRLTQSSAWRDSGVIDERYVAKLITAHQSGKWNAGQELWSVIMFDAFLTNSHP